MSTPRASDRKDLAAKDITKLFRRDTFDRDSLEDDRVSGAFVEIPDVRIRIAIDDAYILDRHISRSSAGFRRESDDLRVVGSHRLDQRRTINQRLAAIGNIEVTRTLGTAERRIRDHRLAAPRLEFVPDARFAKDRATDRDGAIAAEIDIVSLAVPAIVEEFGV